MSRLVVVGAGLGGLAVAARLAALGHDVTVCEQASTVGGKLGWYTENGFSFDTGPSLVTLPHLLDETFAATGSVNPLRLRLLDPLARYRFADGTWVDIAADTTVTAKRFDDLLGPGQGAGYLALLDHGRRLWQATRGPFLERPLAGLVSLGALAARHPGDVTLVAPWRTLRALGEARLPDPRLRAWLDRYATYSGSDPRRAPAALASIPYVEAAFGGWYVTGGLRQIATALAERVVAAGAQLRTNARVARILVSRGRVQGAQLAGGEVLPADAVVSAVDASVLYRTLLAGEPAAAAPLRRLTRAPASFSGFALLLGLRGRTPGLAHHTVTFPGDYDSEFDDLAAGRPVRDPAIYISAPADAAGAPPGQEAWFVLVNAPRHGHGPTTTDWDSPGLAENYADTVLRLLAERGLDVRHRVALRRVRTPADLERDTASPGGAIYGTSSDGVAAAFLRPANRSPVAGLYLVGGSAHPGGGLPLVLLGARIVTELITREAPHR